MIEDLAQQLLKDINRFVDSSRASAEAAFSKDQLKTVIESALKKMDLVTREEFDAQQAVLLRTREMVAALEQQVAALEAEADATPANKS
jgi:BMFP domain-containing protein YqiC